MKPKRKTSIKIFSQVLVFVLFSLWASVFLFRGKLENALFRRWQERYAYVFSAQALFDQQLEYLQPLKMKDVAELNTLGQATLAVLLKEDGTSKILFEKNAEAVLPIASLTKLMTAWVVLEYYDLTKDITISKLSASQYGELGRLQAGKTFPVKYLLYPLLMESSNGAAFALAHDYQDVNGDEFIQLMNLEAEKIGMQHTSFYNPSGLDSEESGTKVNYSTASDLVLLVKELLKKPLIWEILSLPKYSAYGPELFNTNELLIPNGAAWQDKIIGGKTGYTVKAGGCFLLVSQDPNYENYLVNVVLGTRVIEERFSEMKKLLNWLNLAYKW